jgi:lysophospholipase L1-like esterase
MRFWRSCRERDGLVSGRARVAVLLTVAVLVLGVAYVTGRPTRVLLVGDSLTAEYGATGASELRGHGFHVETKAYPGLGLLDRPVIDDVARVVAEFEPDVVVAEFIGNYATFSPVRHGVAPDSPAFRDAWSAAASETTRIAMQHDARIYWVLNPPMRGAYRARTPMIDEIYRGLATDPDLHSGVRYIDATSPFGGASGYLPEYRDNDGVHLNDACAKLLSTTVARQIVSDEGWANRLHLRRG